jgi:hypothetical protein
MKHSLTINISWNGNKYAFNYSRRKTDYLEYSTCPSFAVTVMEGHYLPFETHPKVRIYIQEMAIQSKRFCSVDGGAK